MNQKLQELIKQAGTDCSGKWMGMNHAEKFAELIIEQCVDNLFLHGYDDAASQVIKHFEIKK
jgi:hypothetical protein